MSILSRDALDAALDTPKGKIVKEVALSQVPDGIRDSMNHVMDKLTPDERVVNRKNEMKKQAEERLKPIDAVLTPAGYVGAYIENLPRACSQSCE